MHILHLVFSRIQRTTEKNSRDFWRTQMVESEIVRASSMKIEDTISMAVGSAKYKQTFHVSSLLVLGHMFALDPK